MSAGVTVSKPNVTVVGTDGGVYLAKTSFYGNGGSPTGSSSLSQ